ncbi:uncharacterized protein LOC131440192 [Malaya genurostris]|uniref:uncharacterized protein LOC131440192 n=1 Tax=Malaya genurostris TaxID=325434 RepID=UPI0026F3BAB8|nr:uncharacterized protein LOC131440192 [Malaya genurostris]
MANLLEICKKEVVYQSPRDGSTGVAEWASHEPCYADKNRFILFQDKSSKKSYNFDDLTEQLLLKWRSKAIFVIVYPYTTNIISQKDFDFVKTNLIDAGSKDRSGADSTCSLMSLVAKLKRIHGSRYDATESVYLQWANFIQHAPGHKREQLMEDEPPEQYKCLFKNIDGPANTKRLNTIRQNDGMAENVMDRAKSDIASLRSFYDAIVDAVKTFGEKLSEIEIRMEERHCMLEMIQESVTVSEDEFSQSIAAEITDMPDVDHDDN